MSGDQRDCDCFFFLSHLGYVAQKRAIEQRVEKLFLDTSREDREDGPAPAQNHILWFMN